MLLRPPARGSAAGRPARRAGHGGPPHRAAAGPPAVLQQRAAPLLSCPPRLCPQPLAWACIGRWEGRRGASVDPADLPVPAPRSLMRPAGSAACSCNYTHTCRPALPACHLLTHLSPELSTSYSSDLRSAAGSPAASSAAFLPSLAAAYNSEGGSGSVMAVAGRLHPAECMPPAEAGMPGVGSWEALAVHGLCLLACQPARQAGGSWCCACSPRYPQRLWPPAALPTGAWPSAAPAQRG